MVTFGWHFILPVHRYNTPATFWGTQMLQQCSLLIWPASSLSTSQQQWEIYTQSTSSCCELQSSLFGCCFISLNTPFKTAVLLKAQIKQHLRFSFTLSVLQRCNYITKMSALLQWTYKGTWTHLQQAALSNNGWNLAMSAIWWGRAFCSASAWKKKKNEAEKLVVRKHCLRLQGYQCNWPAGDVMCIVQGSV